MNIGFLEIIRKFRLRYGSPAKVNDILRKMGMRIGEDSHVYTLRIPGEAWLVRIGSHCTISSDVTFVTHNATRVLQHKHETLTGFGCIDIKDYTHVGVNATIMPDITAGPHCIIGAGSVVTKDVPPNTVVAGNPARVICTIDEYEAKCKEKHIDVPKDRDEMRKVLEKHFWGDED